VLTVDDVELIITTISDTSEDILQRNKEKHQKIYDRIKVELKGVQKSLYSSHTVSTTPSSLVGIELGDDLAQLRRLTDATDAHLHHVQEEKEQTTKALKKLKEEALEQRWVVQQEKDDLQAKFAEEREQIQK
jgi:hypothetical protein